LHDQILKLALKTVKINNKQRTYQASIILKAPLFTSPVVYNTNISKNRRKLAVTQHIAQASHHQILKPPWKVILVFDRNGAKFRIMRAIQEITYTSAGKNFS
jgi:hypothetical protein